MHLFISSVNCMAGHFLPCASYAPLSSFLLSSAIPLHLLSSGRAQQSSVGELKPRPFALALLNGRLSLNVEK